MSRTGRAGVVAAALLGLVLSACSGGGGDEMARAAAQIAAAATSTTEPPPTVTTTTLPPEPTSTTPSTVALAGAATATTEPPGLGPGARGAAVAALETRLDALRYDVGTLDDVYDGNTVFAVTAFQKVEGMARTGRATDDVLAALATATAPAPLVPAGGENRVEVDIVRQVLFLYKAGVLQKILPVSSGSNERFCSEGRCRRAVTPGGSFAIYRQARGWETGPLGSLYNPQYFNGGIAIHGSRSVPAQPASHGCIRIPMSAAEWFPGQVHMGMPVHVYGVEGQPPMSQPPPAPADAAPAAPAGPPPVPTAPAPTAPPTTAPGLLGGLFRPPA